MLLLQGLKHTETNHVNVKFDAKFFLYRTRLGSRPGPKPGVVKRLSEQLGNTTMGTPVSMRLGPKPVAQTSTLMPSQSKERRQKNNLTLEKYVWFETLSDHLQCNVVFNLFFFGVLT